MQFLFQLLRALRLIWQQNMLAKDPENLAAVTRLVRGGARHGVPTLVAVDNKAEGCAPETIVRLAQALAESAAAAAPRNTD